MFWIVVALAVILLFLMFRKGGDGIRSWDHEAQLIRLCHGDKAMAERLIQYELERSPRMSKARAALSAAKRLRRDRGS